MASVEEVGDSLNFIPGSINESGNEEQQIGEEVGDIYFANHARYDHKLFNMKSVEELNKTVLVDPNAQENVFPQHSASVAHLLDKDGLPQPELSLENPSTALRPVDTMQTLHGDQLELSFLSEVYKLKELKDQNEKLQIEIEDCTTVNNKKAQLNTVNLDPEIYEKEI